MLVAPEAALGLWQADQGDRVAERPSAVGLGEDRGTTKIISGNVHALAPRIGEVSLWEADILVLQETKLTAHAIKDAREVARDAGWTFLHGQPCRPTTRTSKRAGAPSSTSATEANSGGVATMIKKPRRDLGHKLDARELTLHQTGRWNKTTTALKKGKGILTTAGFYGISGTISCPRVRKQNEILLSQAIDLMISAGDQPYILIGDFNVIPEMSPAIAAAINAGLAVDVGHTFAPDTEVGDDG